MIFEYHVDIRRKWTKLGKPFDEQTLILYITVSYSVVNNQQICGTRVQASVIGPVIMFYPQTFTSSAHIHILD